jgi:hypothetical protein
MIDPSKCRAKDVNTCWKHGPARAVEDAYTDLQNNGVTPERLNTYYEALKKLEEVEKEVARKEWAVQAAKENRAHRVRPNRPGRIKYTKLGRRESPKVRTTPFVAAQYAYEERFFPKQVLQLADETQEQAVFTRHDQAATAPKGIMLAVNHQLTPTQRAHLIGLLQYQHTIAIREEGKQSRKPDDKDLVADHSGRSVYMKTQFKEDGSQLKEFHAGLNKILQEGSTERKDGTRKYPPFGQDTPVVVYYNT